MFTEHARIRMKQRGFTRNQVELIINYGHERISRGANVFTLTRKLAKQMRKDTITISDIDKCTSAYVVLWHGKIKTVAHII